MVPSLPGVPDLASWSFTQALRSSARTPTVVDVDAADGVVGDLSRGDHARCVAGGSAEADDDNRAGHDRSDPRTNDLVHACQKVQFADTCGLDIYDSNERDKSFGDRLIVV